MFRFNKDMEYALISLVEMSRLNGTELLSARELSEKFAIPFKLLARVLQKLSAESLIQAVKGPRGGYRLNEKPENINVGGILTAVRGEEKIAECLTPGMSCTQEKYGCTIKPIIEVFQDKWVSFVENTSLDEFIR